LDVASGALTSVLFKAMVRTLDPALAALWLLLLVFCATSSNFFSMSRSNRSINDLGGRRSPSRSRNGVLGKLASSQPKLGKWAERCWIIQSRRRFQMLRNDRCRDPTTPLCLNLQLFRFQNKQDPRQSSEAFLQRTVCAVYEICDLVATGSTDVVPPMYGNCFVGWIRSNRHDLRTRLKWPGTVYSLRRWPRANASLPARGA
jgi:hypothetical protein